MLHRMEHLPLQCVAVEPCNTYHNIGGCRYVMDDDDMVAACLEENDCLVIVEYSRKSCCWFSKRADFHNED